MDRIKNEKVCECAWLPTAAQNVEEKATLIQSCCTKSLVTWALLWWSPSQKQKRSWSIQPQGKNDRDRALHTINLKKLKEQTRKVLTGNSQPSAPDSASRQLVWLSCHFQFDVTWETKLLFVLTAIWSQHLYPKGRGFLKDAGFLTLQDTYQTPPRALAN